MTTAVYTFQFPNEKKKFYTHNTYVQALNTEYENEAEEENIHVQQNGTIQSFYYLIGPKDHTKKTDPRIDFQ